MTEWRLFTGDVPYVSTLEFHLGRDRAPHLEQPDHQQRLHHAAGLIHHLAPRSVVDLGCGDGGFLSLLTDLDAWGYDFSPVNQQGWQERGVRAEVVDVFNGRNVPEWGELAVCCEVLEHVADPHGTVEWIARNARFIVASSPHNETDQHHGDCHAWAWNIPGYRDLFEPHFEILEHEILDWSQVYVGQSRYVN